MAVPPIECVFFDLDDTLYKNGWATMDQVTARAGEYCTSVLGLPPGTDYKLYKTYGTTVSGLVREGLLEERQVGDFLRFMHDVPLDGVRPAPGLRAMLQAIPHKRWVFTASIREHAERCLRRLGIEDLFLGIVSASSQEMIARFGFVSKHDPRCFTAAMDFAEVPREHAAGCMLLDDSPSNLRTAKEMGWQTVLVGLQARDGSRVHCPHADAAVSSILEICSAVPELFTRRAAGTEKVASDGKRPRDEETTASPGPDVGFLSETESTSAGEDLESPPTRSLNLGAKRTLHHYPSDSTDASYEGFPAERGCSP
mmetsp:Transcript_20959/g.65632  ORF Transcript_20959/g.65632 Transcript_20959/m.65632 type:complete len:312 (-) Transcript_20959:260-1195(-)